MKKNRLILLSSMLLILLSGFLPINKADDKPGFTITVNGDQFKNRVFFIPAFNATYCNLYFDATDDPRARRTVLLGYKSDNSLQVNINVPIHKTAGSFTFIEDSIPAYMWFDFTYETNDGTRTAYLPGKMTVNITRYGNVGEFIEGNLSGELHLGDKKITLRGSFKVKRIKDKI